MNFVDIDKDKEILLEDLELSERAKNVLRRFLRVETFGDLLKVDYEKLKNTRSLGKITLEEIRTFVHSKGYFLLNESVSWKEKRNNLKNSGYKLLEDEGLGYDESRFFYVNNLFTLDDIFYYGKEVFYLKGFGIGKQEELNKFLNKVYITLDFEESTKILKQYKEMKEKNNDFNTELLDNISIKEIGNLYIGVRKSLINSGIVMLKDLMNIDYNDLKDKLSDISDMELLELVNFLQYYGFEIKGYDQTNYNTRPLKCSKMKALTTRFKELAVERQVLFFKLAKLELQISSILKEMEELEKLVDDNNYGKVR